MRVFRTAACLSLICATLFACVSQVCAADYDVFVTNADVSFKPARPLVGHPVQIYATVQNRLSSDVEGLVQFLDNEIILGQKPFSAKANGRADEIWINWTPLYSGDHVIHVAAVNDAEHPDATMSDNAVNVAIFVDKDTDGNGIGDTVDKADIPKPAPVAPVPTTQTATLPTQTVVQSPAQKASQEAPEAVLGVRVPKRRTRAFVDAGTSQVAVAPMLTDAVLSVEEQALPTSTVSATDDFVVQGGAGDTITPVQTEQAVEKDWGVAWNNWLLIAAIVTLLFGGIFYWLSRRDER